MKAPIRVTGNIARYALKSRASSNGRLDARDNALAIKSHRSVPPTNLGANPLFFRGLDFVLVIFSLFQRVQYITKDMGAFWITKLTPNQQYKLLVASERFDNDAEKLALHLLEQEYARVVAIDPDDDEPTNPGPGSSSTSTERRNR